jgi:hypothetical protein
MLDPEREFKNPHRVVEDQVLSAKQKIAVLISWRLGILELQRATAENMTSPHDDAGEIAENLKNVTDALVELGANEDKPREF